MTIYSDLAAVATELLTVGADTFGQAISIVRPAVSVEPANPWEKPTFGADVTTALKAAAFGVTPQRLQFDALIESGDLVVIAAPYASEPALTDFVLVNSQQHRIVSIAPIPADKTNLCAWELIVRRM